MKKKILLTIFVVVVLTVVVGVIFLLVRKSSNRKIALKAKAEFDAWAASIERVPDDENGALDIAEAQKMMGLDDYEKNNVIKRIYMGEFSLDNESDVGLLREFMDNSSEAVSMLEKGLEKKKWQYTQDLEKGFSATIPSLLTGKCTAKVLTAVGDLALRDGDMDGAIKQYLNVLKLSITLSQDPVLITRMIEVALSVEANLKILKLVESGKLSEAQLKRMVGEMKKLYALRKDLSEAMDTEYHTMLYGIHMCAGIKLIDKDRPDLSPWIHDFGKEIELAGEWRGIMSLIDAKKFYGTRHKTDVKKRWDSFEKGLMGPNRRTLMGLMCPSLFTAFESMAESELVWRGVLVAAAIEHHKIKNGKLPDTLDQLESFKGRMGKEMLKDPFSDGNLTYRPEADDYLLYSFGANFKDDNAAESPSMTENDAWRMCPDYVIHAPKKTEPGSKK
ncbi:MAG: hypothetical protein ACYS8W_00840 [Planctomycetota bacterium]|jgi:hypothetical protein